MTGLSSSCPSSCILWNLSTFMFIAFVLLLGSSSLSNLASYAANLSSILASLFPPTSLISLIVEFMSLIWTLTDCSTISLVCFIITFLRCIISSILSSDLLDTLSIYTVPSMSFASSIPLISLRALMFFFSLVCLRQSQQRSLTRHCSFHPVVSKCCSLRSSSRLSVLFFDTRDTVVLLGFSFFFLLLPWFFWSPVFCHIGSWLSFHWTFSRTWSCRGPHRDLRSCLQWYSYNSPPWWYFNGSLELVTFIFFSFGLMSFCLGSLDPAFWFALSPSLTLLCFFEKRRKYRSDSVFQGITLQSSPNSAFEILWTSDNITKSVSSEHSAFETLWTSDCTTKSVSRRVIITGPETSLSRFGRRYLPVIWHTNFVNSHAFIRTSNVGYCLQRDALQICSLNDISSS